MARLARHRRVLIYKGYMPSFTRHDAELLAELAEKAIDDPGAAIHREPARAGLAAVREAIAKGGAMVEIGLSPAERRALKFCWDTLADGDASVSDAAFERVRAALA